MAVNGDANPVAAAPVSGRQAPVIPLDPRRPAGPRSDAGRTPSLGVSSEVGALHRVLVHRPDLELSRLSPENKEELLFDDVVWPERAVEEHDALTAVLQARGVEVLYLHDLLSDVLEIADVRAALVERVLGAAELGPTLSAPLAAWLASLPAGDLVRRLVGGVRYDELPFTSTALLAQLTRRDAFVLSPLANQLFTRDSSTWLSRGVLINAMARPARRREPLLLEAVYRHHPVFTDSASEIWSDGLPGAAQLEGGDVHVLGESTLLIGVGERTSPVAVELYASRLFEAEVIEQVIAVALPTGRASIHLDTILTMVDLDAFMVYPPVSESLDAYLLRPHKNRVIAEPAPDLFRSISAILGTSVRLIEGASDSGTARREQWDEAANLLALAPGVVVGYERNRHANAALAEHGMEVIAVAGSEIARGRGGPRCLTCPLARDPI